MSKSIEGKINLQSGMADVKVFINDKGILCLQFNNDVDTNNWYHSVMITRKSEDEEP